MSKVNKVNRGKQFESRFQKDWKRCFPNTLVLRLKDDTSGYYGNSKNPCDFICFPGNKLYMLEVKSHYTNRFPFSAFTQYDTLITYKDCKDVEIGLIVWFIDFDRVIYFPLESIIKMREDGLKSINLNKVEELNKYNHIEIPSQKKRVFLESDYYCIIK